MAEHLLRLNNGMAIDVIDVPLFEVLKQTTYLNQEVRDELDALSTSFRYRIGNGRSSEDARAILQSFVTELEHEIALRLSRRSLPFWLTMFRWILGVNKMRDRTEATTLVQDARLIELCLARYARYDITDLREIDGVWTIEPSTDDVRALLQTTALARLASMYKVDLRRLALGGKLATTPNAWSIKMPTLDTEKLMALYSKRLATWGNVFRHAGVPGDSMLPHGRGHWWIALAGKNEDGLYWSGASKSVALSPQELPRAFVGPHDAYVPTFFLDEFSVDLASTWLELLGDDIQSRAGFRPEAALVVLRAASALGIDCYQTYRLGHRLRTFAFMFVSKVELESRILEEAKQAGVTSSEDLDAAFRFLTRSQTDASGIDVHAVAHSRCFVEFNPNVVLLDLQVTFSAVRSLFDLVGTASGDHANLRGRRFEDDVCALLRATFPQASVWKAGRRVRFVDGTIREVDLALIIGNVMLLLECKAFAQRDAGAPTRSGVASRWRSLCDALQQVDQLALKLRTTSTRAHEPLLSSVEWIVPCVITPAVEWIPETRDEFWLNESVPRICTMGEVLEVGNMIAAGQVPQNAIALKQDTS